MQKLEVFYSKFYSANTFSRLGRLCERKWNHRFSKCDYSYLLLFVLLDQWNQSLSWTISRTENLINAMFWLLNIYLTGRTQEKRILTNKMTFGTIYCYSLSFCAQTTCLENRNRKKCSSEILWNKEGNPEKHLCLIKKRKNYRRNAFDERTKLNLFHTTAFKF